MKVLQKRLRYFQNIAKTIAKFQKYCKKEFKNSKYCKEYCFIMRSGIFLKVCYSLLNFD